jgi:hypothetical protein
VQRWHLLDGAKKKAISEKFFQREGCRLEETFSSVTLLRKGEQTWQNQRVSVISTVMVRRLSPGRRYTNAWNVALLRLRGRADLIGIPAGWQQYIQMADRMSDQWEFIGSMMPCTSLAMPTPAKRKI